MNNIKIEVDIKRVVGIFGVQVMCVAIYLCVVLAVIYLCVVLMRKK